MQVGHDQVDTQHLLWPHVLSRPYDRGISPRARRRSSAAARAALPLCDPPLVPVPSCPFSAPSAPCWPVQ